MTASEHGKAAGNCFGGNLPGGQFHGVTTWEGQVRKEANEGKGGPDPPPNVPASGGGGRGRRTFHNQRR